MQAHLIKSLIGSESPEATLKLVRGFLRRYPGSPYESTVHLAAAQAYQTLGNLEETFASGEKALRRDPDSIMARLVVAKALVKGATSSNSKAADHLEKSRRYLEEALGLLAESYSNEKESTIMNPIDWAGKRIFLESQAHGTLGSVYLRMEEYELAERELKISLNLNEGAPNRTDLMSLIYVYIRLQNWEAASEVLDRAEKLGRLPTSVLRSYRKQIEQGRVGQ